jgi:group I intron endonuclease
MPNIKCAVYAIRQVSTGRRYFGGSTRLGLRWTQHRTALKAGKHHCLPLQEAYNVSGKGDFVFEVIQPCTPKELQGLEQARLDNLAENDFNIAISAKAGDMLTRHPNKAEIVERRAESQRTAFASMTKEERRAKFGKSGEANGMWGRTHTPEVCAAASARLKGKPSAFKGHKHTDAAKALFSAKAAERTGERNAFFGRHHSEEAKAKIAAARLGVLPTNIRAVRADGVRYVSVTAAARALGVTPGTICFRLRSPNFDYHYCQLNA